MNPPPLPSATTNPPPRRTKTYATLGLICGAGTIATILTALATCTWIFIDAVRHLEQTGHTDPSVVAGDISYVLLVALYGFASSVVFLIPAIIFLVLYQRNRKRSESP